MAIESKRGKKTSSEKVAEVINAKIKNPDASLRDITKETGVNPQTTSDILKKEMPEVLTRTDNSAKLLDTSLEIVADGISIIRDEIKALKLKNSDLKITSMNDLKQLSGTIEENFKRSQLLQGKPTGIIYTPEQWKGFTSEELEKVANGEKIDLN